MIRRFGAFFALVFVLSACTSEPVVLLAPGAPRIDLTFDAAQTPPGTRAVIRVLRSDDDERGTSLVRKTTLMRRIVPHPEFRPFNYVELPRDPAHPRELTFADVSAIPGARYQYAAWAIGEGETTTLTNIGARPASSPLSDVVRIAEAPTDLQLTRSMATDLEVRVSAPKYGDGRSLDLEWDAVDEPVAHHYVVVRSNVPRGPFVPFAGNEVAAAAAGSHEPIRLHVNVPNDEKWYFRVWIVPSEGDSTRVFINGVGVSPETYWMHFGRANVAVLIALTIFFSLFFLWRAQHGKAGFIRRIPGIDAIEEAIGRATEMGRPVLYIPGIDEIQNIQTIASLLILGRVAETVARYDAEIRVPCCIPLVATVGEEVVRQGFFDAGRPDAHRPQNVQWISSEQFAFCAGANGIMLRDKPATNLFLGRFFGESLILAETGYVNRAIQIAGTAEISQLPFFIAACDYTLIGEELFAVSAYMTRDPKLLSTLKAGDAVKAIALVMLVVTVLAAWLVPHAQLTELLLSFLKAGE